MTPSQMARDLGWAITSPSLLRDSAPAFELPPNLTTFPTEITTGHRVGYYFESLVEFWLREIRRVEIVAQGHQIQQGKRTLGEVDFIFRNEEGQLTHWETAVKFYLSLGEDTFGGSHFVGPNSADNLEIKHIRLFSHQLPIGKSAFPEVTQQDAFIKGCIFYHPDETNRRESPLLTSDHQHGLWIRAAEIARLSTISERFGFMEKPHWLAPPDQSLPVNEVIEKLHEHFAKSPRPQLLAAFPNETRVFVVSDLWPEQGSI